MIGDQSVAASMFCAHDRVRRAGAAVGPLRGLTFAVKDVMQVAGARACCGNPTWLRTHPPAARDAVVVQRLLDAGADLCGLLLTDELTLSLTGENAHYGTPDNVRAPGRVPGGSSSGSAAAVAAGLVAFALGTDTGGSVRVPASYCGVYGMRPTHGRVDRDGVVPLCPALDTVGWFARDAVTLQRVGTALLDNPSPAARPRAALLLDDAVDVLAPDARASFTRASAGAFARLEPVRLVDVDLPSLGDCTRAYLTLQNAGLWAEHHVWLRESAPVFGALIQTRFDRLSAPNNVEVELALAVQQRIRRRLSCLLDAGAVLVLPSASAVAHPRGLEPTEIDAITGVGLALSSIASLAGLPQLSMPLAEVDGLPLGVGMIGGAGSDELLLAEACRVSAGADVKNHLHDTGEPA